MYVCPAGQQLVRSGGAHVKKGKRTFRYRVTAAVCGDCSWSGRCVPASQTARHIDRWEHEEGMDRHRRKMRASGPWMRERGALVEHPFGPLKRWAGLDHFLVRGLDKCRGEFSLMTLGYHFKRVINVLGAEALMEYCLQKQRIGGIGV